jgi:hypothetical protein
MIMTYIYKNDQQIGPFNEATIQGFIDRKELVAADFCWREGWTDWKEMKEIYRFPAEVKPPPPPVAKNTSDPNQPSPSVIETKPMAINFKTITRDAVIVMLSSLIVGFLGTAVIIGLNIGESEDSFLLIINGFKMLGATIGFAFCASRFSGDPWKHLCVITGWIWLFSLYYLIQGKIDILGYLFSLPFLFFCTGIGGGIGTWLKGRKLLFHSITSDLQSRL